eukprot:Nk52_evm1s1604 gene=Nk52_evmTU1s1604
MYLNRTSGRGYRSQARSIICSSNDSGEKTFQEWEKIRDSISERLPLIGKLMQSLSHTSYRVKEQLVDSVEKRISLIVFKNENAFDDARTEKATTDLKARVAEIEFLSDPSLLLTMGYNVLITGLNLLGASGIYLRREVTEQLDVIVTKSPTAVLALDSIEFESKHNACYEAHSPTEGTASKAYAKRLYFKQNRVENQLGVIIKDEMFPYIPRPAVDRVDMDSYFKEGNCNNVDGFVLNDPRWERSKEWNSNGAVFVAAKFFCYDTDLMKSKELLEELKEAR